MRSPRARQLAEEYLEPRGHPSGGTRRDGALRLWRSGKRVRPVICWNGRPPKARKPETILPAAVRFELVQNFCHPDDLPALDNDELSRGSDAGVPSSERANENPRGRRALARPQAGAPKRRRPGARLAQATLGMIGGPYRVSGEAGRPGRAPRLRPVSVRGISRMCAVGRGVPSRAAPARVRDGWLLFQIVDDIWRRTVCLGTGGRGVPSPTGGRTRRSGSTRSTLT